MGHLCTLLRRESRYESRRELRQVARAPQPPRRAGGAPSLAPPAWSERQALREWRRCQVGIFAKASTHTNPRRALFLSACHSLASSGGVIAHPVTSSGAKTGKRANKMRLRELVWADGRVTAPVAWTSGPSALASREPWGRRCRGTRGLARSRERPWVRRSVRRPAKTTSRRNHRSHAERAFRSRRGGIAGAECAFP